MQENGAAAAGDPRGGVVVDLDDEVVKVIIASEPIAGLVNGELDRLVVMPAGGVFAPGVVLPDRANREVRFGPRVAVGAPPKPPGTEYTLRGSAVALALIGNDSASSQGDGNGPWTGGQPAAAGIAGPGANTDRRQGPAHNYFFISV